MQQRHFFPSRHAGSDTYTHRSSAARLLHAWAGAALLLLLAACGGGGSKEDVPPPPASQSLAISTQPKSVEVVAGHQVKWAVEARGTGPLAYQWLREGQPIEGATAAEYTIRAFNADSGAQFAVRVSDSLGSVQSQTAQLTVKAPVLPEASFTVQSAVEKPGIVRADGILQRVPGSEWDFNTTADTWSIGQKFLFDNSAYKVANIRKTPNGSFVVEATAAQHTDVFSELKFEIRSPLLAYDEAGKPLRADELRSYRQKVLANDRSGNKNALDVPACLSTSGEVEIPSADGSNKEYGYELSMNCSLEELLGKSGNSSGVRLTGTFAQTGETRTVHDSEQNTSYQEQSATSNASIKFIRSVEFWNSDSLARIEALCKQFRDLDPENNYCQAKADKGVTSLKVARAFLGPKKRTFILPNGVPVPTYFLLGITVNVEISAIGEVSGAWSSSKYVRAGHIRGQKVFDDPPMTHSFVPAANIVGELDFFLGGVVAAGIGDSSFWSAINVSLKFGPYLNGKVDVNPPCVALTTGGRVQLSVTVGRSQWWDGWDIVDQKIDLPSEPLNKPLGCTATPGMTKLAYVVAGKNKYNYSIDESTDTIDVYHAMHSLVARTDPTVPKLIRVDLAGTEAPRGKTIRLDFELLDPRPDAAISLHGDVSLNSAANAYLSIDPGSTSYGDSLKVRITAYVPDNRVETEVQRIIELKIEPRLSANPTYRKRVDVDGSETHVSDFGFMGTTTELLKGGYLEYDVGEPRLLERDENGAWKAQATTTANPCAWYGRVDCREEAILRVPTRLVLFTSSSKNGEGQEFLVTRADPTVLDNVEVSPTSTTAYDILTLKAWGRGMKETVTVQVPNCRNLVEKRSAGNERWENWATDYREFSCETTAPGANLVAKVEGFQAAFTIVDKQCDVGDAVWRGECTRVGKLVTDPAIVIAGREVVLWVEQVWSNVATIVFNFLVDGVQFLVSAANRVSETVRHVYQQAGTFILELTMRDGGGQQVAGKAEFWVEVGQGAVSVSPLAAVAGRTQVFTVSGSGLPSGLQFTLTDCLNVIEIAVGSTPSQRLFSCAFAADVVPGSREGTIATSGSPFGPPPLATFAVMVARPAVTAVAPAATTRTMATTFEITGQELPVSGITVVPMGDGGKSRCQAPNNLTPTGFGVACELFRVGPQQLEVRAGEQLLGAVTVNLTSNVTGVRWTSASTDASGTVKFGELVTYTVKGENLTVDSTMGFAVEKCGVSNTEVGLGTSTERTFSCTFNNEAGAVAGQMSGVVKDAPSGQVLYTFQVPVATAPIDINESIVVSWDLGVIGTPLQGRGTNPRTVVIEPGVEIEGFIDNPKMDVDVGTDRVRLYNFRSYAGEPDSAAATASEFNGLVLTVPSSAGWRFGAATVGSGNTLPGLDAARLNLQSQRLAINLAGLTYHAGTVVEVGFTRGTPSGAATGKLPHTGVTANQCYVAGSNALVACNSPAALALNSQQDGHRASFNPMTYSRVGSYPITSCVKDEVTGLIWEGKEASGARAGGNTYTNVGDGLAGDASAYVAAVNASALCGYTDWRLPAVEELQTLVDYGKPYPGPVIDVAWFPNTAGHLHWSFSPLVGSSSTAWNVNFNNGNFSYGFDLGNYFHVRLVRAIK